MTRRRRRLWLLGACGAALFAAAALVLTAFEDNIVFFYSPTDLTQKPIAPDRHFRLGGLVEEGSVVRQPDGVTIAFRVTDTANAVPVTFRGLLPDLFREGQGVVAEGALDARGTFVATEVLAKHDENYMPPEVAESIKKAGQWKGEAKE